MSRYAVAGIRYGKLLGLVGLGLALEPLGHELAYALHLGVTRALVAQSEGSHAYFPGVAETSTKLLALGLLLCGLAFLSVRIALGRRAPVDHAVVMPAFFVLVATQCTIFFIQESLEAFASHLTPDFVLIGLLALIGQVPIAALLALVLSRVHGYLALAPAAVRALLAVHLGQGTRITARVPALPRK